MAFQNLIYSWCKDPCNPCHCPLLAAAEYETITENQVFYTNYMFGSVPVGITSGRTTIVSYNLTRPVGPLFVDAGLQTPGPVCSPSFAWPVLNRATYNCLGIDYYGGACTERGMIPYTAPAGFFNGYASIGDGFYSDAHLVYELRPDLGYPTELSASITISVSYLDIEIWSTTLTGMWIGYKYAIPPGWGEVGVAQYLFSGLSMSNVPDTPFEVSPKVAERRGWLYQPKLDGPYAQYNSYFTLPPINPKTGNYQFRGFAYNGPIDPKQDIIFTVKAVSTAAPSQPPPARLYASIEDFESNVAQPPIMDCQWIMGQAIYGSRGDPVPVYDYQDFGF